MLYVYSKTLLHKQGRLVQRKDDFPLSIYSIYHIHFSISTPFPRIIFYIYFTRSVWWEGSTKVISQRRAVYLLEILPIYTNTCRLPNIPPSGCLPVEPVLTAHAVQSVYMRACTCVIVRNVTVLSANVSFIRLCECARVFLLSSGAFL